MALQSPPKPWRNLALAAGLALATAVAYAPSLGGAFLWDDDEYVYLNPNLRTVDGLARIWLSPAETPQ